MNGKSFNRAVSYVLPLGLLVAALALVGGQVNRPAALADMWRPWGEVGMLACVMTAIILTGGIDLSVGSIVALSSMSYGLLWQQGWSWHVAGLMAIAVGTLCGAANATLIALGIMPLVATLATMALFSGAAMALSHGQRIAGLSDSFTELGQGAWLGLPVQLILFAVVWSLALVVVHHTRYGRYLFAIGDNRLAARFAAVGVKRVEWMLYTASGLVAGIVALVYTARGGAAVPTAGAGIELQTIACVVLGGTRVTGGSGGLVRTLLGVAIMSLLDIGLQFVSHKIYLPWSDVPWQLNAHTRLILIGSLVIGVAIWNERFAAWRE